MILGFMQKFPWGEPTHFREKILAGVKDTQRLLNEGIFKPAELVEIKTYFSKLHTFRVDPHDRWRPGMSIQMVYRGTKYSIKDHFNKDIPELKKCVSVQKIELKWMTHNFFNVTIDGKSADREILLALVKNDGFDDLKQFTRWFKKDFTGKIIHWTNLRY